MNSCAGVAVGLQVLTLAWAMAGCGGQSAPASSTAEAVPPAAEPPPSTSAEAAAPSADAAPAEAAAAEPVPADPPPAASKPKDPDAAREVKYVVTPEGLKVEVAGVRFLVSAAAKQIAQGWGAKISVKAEALDGKEHVLLSGKNGPIAFAAAVFKKGSTEAERIPDARDGDGELKIGSAGVSFAREFPNKGGRVLAIGETLDMEVALWGLGTSADDRRPVKHFVHVKMKVDKGKPKALVEPPASAAK